MERPGQRKRQASREEGSRWTSLSSNSYIFSLLKYLLTYWCLWHWEKESVYFCLQVSRLSLKQTFVAPCNAHRQYCVRDCLEVFQKPQAVFPVSQLFLRVSLTFTLYHFCLIGVIWKIKPNSFHHTWKIIFETNIYFHLVYLFFSFLNQIEYFHRDYLVFYFFNPL